jgi:outer membrane lipoprotein SlyB
MDPVFDTTPGQKNSHAPVSAAPAPVTGTGTGTANRPLWAAVGVLGVAVAALGGTLLWQNVHGNDSAGAQAVASVPGSQPQALTKEDVLSEKTTTVASAAPVVTAPPVAAVSKPIVTAPVAPAASKGYTGSYAAQPAVARAPVCVDCGRVESVTPIQHAAPASGIGAVAGGVLGAVLGNQFGHGNGRTATTLLGAGGGAYLGNTVEKRTRTTTTYEIRVRMDNGTVRTFEHTEPVQVGQPVTVEGHGFRLGQGQSYSSQAAQNPNYRSVSEPQGTYSSSRY